MKGNDWMNEAWYAEKLNDRLYPKELVLGETLRRNAQRFPQRPAVVYQDRSRTYRELNTRVNRLANSMLKLGIRKGDVIGIFSHNSDHYVETGYAIAKTGCIFIPINFRLVGPEVEYILNFNEAAAVFVDFPVLEVILSIRSSLKAKHIIVMRPQGPLPDGVVSFDDLIASGSEAEPDVDVWEGDFVGLAQTGGTTGRPKGVMFTHRVACSIIYQVCYTHNYLETDRGLHAMPSYSSAGIAYDWGATPFHGGTIHIATLPPFDPVGILEIIHKEKINHLTLTPIMLEFLIAFLDASPGKYDMSSVRTLISVGAPTSVRVREAAVKHFGQTVYVEYSATEMGVATMLKPDEVLKYPESCGRQALGQEIRIIDDKGRELPRGQIGEIAVAGIMATAGYNKNPDATRQALHGRFLGIGDMAYMDEAGYVYIVDRKSDMIISGGMNIYPAEIEVVMIGNSKIAEVAVIGVPDEQWGENVKAIVRITPGQTTTEEEIIEWCRGKMAGYRIPKSVDFIDDFPRTAAGKVQKSVLRKKYWGGWP
jgi:acyl-CoA synthetase (AMP-forming)/AMP-acid ligase II